ncbi:hypothetical protein [Mycoplasmopsis cynos]|nr:hypothetical protein [Mycoplasmopsis cynos]WAM04258.1 hypothetical protein ONA01_04270 [Mycoplasmopsis cynos]
MKKFLISIISGIKTIKGLENSQAQSQFTEEGTKLQNKILSTKNVEDYKKVKQEAEAFAKKWEAGATRNWVRFFVERVEKHSNQSPQEAYHSQLMFLENQFIVLKVILRILEQLESKL